ncbi:GAF domain-containing sensor histidine kinase [Thiobacter aerophilum]|uniref:Oxygen sensor histidine kinase NreB n=1 Tax=Thiobacter aerophilum TaxID=3121275 RepID=A0ABV0EG56_9BURK
MSHAKKPAPPREPEEERGGYKLPALRVYSEIATSLSSDADLEQLLERFLQTMIRLAGATAGAVRVVSSDGQHMRLVGAIGLPQEVIDREYLVPIGCGVCGRAAQHFAIQRGEAAGNCHEVTLLDYFGEGCKNVIAVPLRHKGKTMGVYNLFMPCDRSIPEEVALLFLSISEHLGMALENARLTRENLRITLMDERQMLAAEIHDSLAQTLAYMKMRLAMLREAVREGDELSTERYLGEVDDALESAYSGLRELLTQFRQKMDPRGLLPALEDLMHNFCNRTGIKVDFINRAPDVNLTPDQEVQVFHIVQEALNNISKHSAAQHVSLTIEFIGDRYALTVTDDGIGLKTQGSNGPSMHLGMSIMKERAQRLGGEVIVESRPGQGTRVHLEFPAPRPRRVGAR